MMTILEAKTQPERGGLHNYCAVQFTHLPDEVKEHRRYFSEKRGFGEDAFHTMWYMLFNEFRPSSALEIGVYQGQVITLWKLLSKTLGFECRVSCISPFSSAGDSTSRYASKDYLSLTEENHKKFGLDLPDMCRCLSTEKQAELFVAGRKFDLVYIDGNHDYEVVKSDFELCLPTIVPGGLLVLDDSAIGTSYVPSSDSFSGHQGPSRLASELSLEEIFSAGHNRVFQVPIKGGAQTSLVNI